MEIDKSDTRSKIISTAIDMIGKQVNLNFTIREIAEVANVNLASVNYYFRSKENLINEVEQCFSDATHMAYKELLDSNTPPRTRMVRWAESTMEYLMKYPGMLFMMATKILSGDDKSRGIIQLIKNSEGSLILIVREIFTDVEEEVISYKTMQFMSGVITPMIFLLGTGTTFNIDISDPNIRKSYIENLVDSVLK